MRQRQRQGQAFDKPEELVLAILEKRKKILGI
jgi:hypothetical protein